MNVGHCVAPLAIYPARPAPAPAPRPPPPVYQQRTTQSGTARRSACLSPAQRWPCGRRHRVICEGRGIRSRGRCRDRESYAERCRFRAANGSTPHSSGKTAKRAGLPSRLCHDTMRSASRASLPVGKPCGDTDPQFSIGRSSSNIPLQRDLRRAFRISRCRRTQGGIPGWRDMTTGIPANYPLGGLYDKR